MAANLLSPANAPNPRADIPAIPAGVQLHTLENGLTVIVREDHTAPVVSAQAWCMAGSIHEGRWLGAGMSHVLEHMLFKGTTSRPGSRIDQEVQEAGGYMNAYTSFDRTVYHIDVPNTGASVAIDILCDIMQHATLPPDEMAKEKQVIVREMDMNIDDPARRASRRLFETAYTRSPYRFTVIGYPDIFHELTPEDITSYYREKYVPNNVFYVIAGDIRTEEVLAQIRQAYSRTKARALPPIVLPEEPTQTAPREIIEEAPIELGHVHMAWHIPDVRHPDVPVLDVLAAVLGNGRSSRLFREVREKKGLAHSADAWTYSPGNPGLFGVSAVVDADQFKEAREAILQEIEQLQQTAIPAAELAKAVKQFIAGTLAARKTMQGQAQDLGANWLAANDLNFSERYLAAIKRATSEDLQRVARQYLTPENRTLYALVPPGTTPAENKRGTVSLDEPIQKLVLGNGLTILLKEDHRLPFVEFRAVLKGGVLAETSALNGVSQLTAKMLLKGTHTRSAEQIASEIESVGGSIDSFGGYNTLGVSAEVLSSDFALGLALLADVLLQPAFPGPEFEREREIQLALVRAQKDQLLQSAAKTMREAMFGPIGYGLDVLGSEESLGRISLADLKRFHERLVAPDNCVLAIYGDLKPSDVKAAVEAAFSHWRSQRADSPFAIAPRTQLSEIKKITQQRDKKQAVMVIGFPGTDVHNPDRYPLELIQEACSDLGSRLFMRIREKLGLAYFVGAQNVVGLAPGYFSFYVGTMPEKVDLVEQELLAEAALLRTEGLTEEELKRSKAKIIGQKKIARQDLGSLALTNALDELYGLGYAHTETEDALLEGVTLDQIKRVAQRYLRNDGFVISTIVPGSA